MPDEKQISNLNIGAITNNNDVFAMDTYGGITVKIPYSVLATALLHTSLEAGSNITITDTTEQDGIKKYTIASAASGSVWYFGNTQPVSANANDYWLRTDTGNYGNVDRYDGTTWTNVGTFAGRDGQDGQDGITPSIDNSTKHWMIGSTDTGVVAEGQDGATGATGAAGADGASITASAVSITGGHRVTITSTDPNVSDVVFDVMDGNAGGYAQGDGIAIAGNVISVKLGNGLNINSQTGNIDVNAQGNITVSDILTLTTNGWNNNAQTVSFAHDTNRRNVIDVVPTDIPAWGAAGVYASAETSAGITFICSSVPVSALTFRVTSMGVS